MQENVTTAIVHVKKRTKKDGKYPVKLRVTYERDWRFYGINRDLTEDEFDKVNLKNPRGIYKDLKLELSAIEDKAKKVIESVENFSFDEFKARFYRKTTDTRNVYYYYDTYIEKLEKEGRIGTAGNYKGSLSSIKRFSGKKDSLDFSKITVSFLEKYEGWMKENGNSVASIGFYLRPLRAICRIGIKNGGMNQEQYPFERDKYQIPRKRNIKKALEMKEITALLNYERDEFSIQDMAIDFWILSYLCNGANIKDLLKLRYKDIGHESITFIRAKTERSKKDQETISVPIIDRISKIIEKWGTKPKDPDKYVFPMLTDELTPMQEFERIKGFVKKINTNIQPIAESLGISKKVTTYTARHSFSTVLKRAGASTELIKESLGHSSIQTTESYLDSFENEVKKEFAKKLLPEENVEDQERTPGKETG
jgi:site-specific recombinase XerD